MKYNWQYTEWPDFVFDNEIIQSIELNFALETAELKGIVDTLPENIQKESIIQIMIEEAIKTSEIEGEFYSRDDVMSSIKKRLGIHSDFNSLKDKNAKGVAELMVEVRTDFDKTLTEDLIKNWHKILFLDSRVINAGEYRQSPEAMQIVSGTYGNETVHFEAPPSLKVPLEMGEFIKWYSDFDVKPNDVSSALIKTSIAHLYFESIHPFEDGNGRIGRAIAEKCLSECFNRPLILSLSSAIENDRKAYYNSLKEAQSSLTINNWIRYFSETILAAQKKAKEIISFTLKKISFLDSHKALLNDRQLKVVLKMLEQGSDGFKGGMSAKKYISITKTSKATATRDLQNLVENGAFIATGAGRSVHYDLKLL